MSPAAVVADVAIPLCKMYRVTKVVGDNYAGEFAKEPFAKAGVTYELAKQHKAALYRDPLLPLLNSRQIVFPRQIAMYLCKHLTEASLPEIGRQFGGKHHTTVLHSVHKIERLRQVDKDLNKTINRLLDSFG